jgi:hypothetical protein
MVRDKTLLQALVTSPNRAAFVPDGSDPMALEKAGRYRRRLEADIVLPACNRAYNDLRLVAGEYIDDEDEVDPEKVDPSRQGNVAMRPAFQEKDEQQRQALTELWSGFVDVDDLLDWCHWLDEPTNGSVDANLSHLILNDETAREHLLPSDVGAGEAQRYRERLASVVLLPAFAKGLRRMDAGELIKQTRDGLTVAPG